LVCKPSASCGWLKTKKFTALAMDGIGTCVKAGHTFGRRHLTGGSPGEVQ
jgi:hypothetical protein